MHLNVEPRFESAPPGGQSEQRHMTKVGTFLLCRAPIVISMSERIASFPGWRRRTLWCPHLGIFSAARALKGLFFLAGVDPLLIGQLSKWGLPVPAQTTLRKRWGLKAT